MSRLTKGHECVVAFAQRPELAIPGKGAKAEEKIVCQGPLDPERGWSIVIVLNFLPRALLPIPPMIGIVSVVVIAIAIGTIQTTPESWKALPIAKSVHKNYVE